MTGSKRESKKRMGDRNQGQGVGLVADHVKETVIKRFHFILIVIEALASCEERVM